MRYGSIAGSADARTGDTTSICGVWGNMSTAPVLTRLIATFGQLGGISRQGRRIAGDVDDPGRAELDDALDLLLAGAGPRRVEDDQVRPAVELDVLEHRPDLAGDESGSC